MANLPFRLQPPCFVLANLPSKSRGRAGCVWYRLISTHYLDYKDEKCTTSSWNKCHALISYITAVEEALSRAHWQCTYISVTATDLGPDGSLCIRLSIHPPILKSHLTFNILQKLKIQKLPSQRKWLSNLQITKRLHRSTDGHIGASNEKMLLLLLLLLHNRIWQQLWHLLFFKKIKWFHFILKFYKMAMAVY